MPYEHKDMSGSFWENDKKTEDRHPDWKGQIKIGGKLYDIAGWLSDKVDRLMNLKISEPRQQQQGGYQGEQQQTRQAPRPAPQQQQTNTTRARPQSNRPVDSGMRTSAAQEMLGEPEGVKDEDIPF